MIAILTQFFLSAAIIVGAGIILTKMADRIAHLTGLGGLLVGSVFLAAATSLPELMVDVSAVRQGLPDIAVGDLFGSSLFNLLILAICDLLHKERGRLFSHASVAHALSGIQCIALTALAGLGLLLSPYLAPYAVGGISITTLAIIAAYILGLRLIFNDQRVAHLEQRTKAKLRQRGLKPLTKPFMGYIVAATMILVAAPLFADAAGEIADRSGLGNTFVGTVLVAFCTSLPELVASLAAVRMGAYDLALGNIFGSNTFNMVLFVPLDFISDGPLFASVSPTHLVTCLATIIITAVAVMGEVYKVEDRKKVIEPDAGLVIGLVTLALATVYFLR